jgi:hypothetical protein
MARPHLTLSTAELLVIAALSVQLFLLPNNLPLGYEQAKVIGIYLLGVVSLCLLGFKLFKTLRGGDFHFPVFKLGFLGYAGLIMGLSLVVTLVSPVWQTALYGNPFRLFGFFTLLALAFTAVAVYFYADQIRLRVVLLAQLAITLVQALLALGSALLLLYEFGSSRGFALIYEGNYIGGNFGQTNFLAATMLAGIVLALEFEWPQASRRLKQLIVALFGLTLLATMSRTAIALLCGYMLLKLTIYMVKKLFPGRSLSLRPWQQIALLGLASLALMLAAYQLDDSRELFWRAFGKISAANPLGQGLDTQLVQVLASGHLPGRIVDRAHNFPLDLTVSIGWLGLSLVLILLAHAWTKSQRHPTTRILGILIACFWFTGLVNTKSAYHYLELAVYLSLIFALSRSKSRT